MIQADRDEAISVFGGMTPQTETTLNRQCSRLQLKTLTITKITSPMLTC